MSARCAGVHGAHAHRVSSSDLRSASPRCAPDLRSGLLALAALLCVGCEGAGDGGGGLVVKDEVLDPRCTPVAGSLPAGLALLPGAGDRAALVQFQPPALVSFELGGERPRVLGFAGIPADSDGDGYEDSDRSRQLGFFPLAPVLGGVEIARPDLALISASNYEQVLFADPSLPTLRTALVENPQDAPGYRPEDYPFLPQDGMPDPRTAISTRACIYPETPADSGGGRILADPRCDPMEPASYFTNLTAGKTVAAGRLFVATSNLRSSGLALFYPGTVLVYDLEEDAGALWVRPQEETPVLFSSDFNPTGVTRHVNAAGRELVLVTNTGAIGAGTGSANLRTATSVDVIDAARLRIVACIPLGVAGPSFDRIAIDPSGRIGLLGATSRRELYAIDLAPLDDDRLFEGEGEPVQLDGLTTGFPDARIFDADRSLVLPDRPDGAPPAQCEGFTHVAVDAAGRELFATDYCDGTLARVRVDLSGPPPVPVPQERFQAFRLDAPFAPLSGASLGLLRGPSLLRVRPGVPGADYTGPDVFVLVGLPDAQLCGVRVASR